MKKLIIAALVASAAAVSQAVTLHWNWAVTGAASTIMDGSPSTVANTTVYMYADYTSAAARATAVDGVLTALRANAGAASAITGYTATGSLNSSGVMDSSVAHDSDAFTTSQNNNFAAIVLATAADGSVWAAVSTLAKKGLGTGAAAVNFNYSGFDSDYLYTNMTDTFADNGMGWYKVANAPQPPPIPEPTSGLLVLLGVAGLALRRKMR